MATIEDLGEVISTDVLIVGGGIGGLAVAVKAKEENPECRCLNSGKTDRAGPAKPPKSAVFWPFSDRIIMRINFLIFRSAPPVSI